MGLWSYAKAIDDALPKKDDSPSETLGKMLTYPAAGVMAILELFNPDPPSSSGGSSGGGQSGGGDCHCDCKSHWE
jgi:hypothetical protein